VFRSRLEKPPEDDPGTAILTGETVCGRPLVRDDLALLRSLTTLPMVVKGVCHVPDVPVLFDSGVRSGTDVVKALAFGATAVGIGRPYAYGAAPAGAAEVVHVLRTVLAEAGSLMAVDGYPTIADLGRDAIRRT
jgi:lactate 2-monooxygenase